MTPLLAALSLVAGFGAAEASGNRSAGGAVLLALALAAAARCRRTAGTGRALLLLVAVASAFAASHVLARAVGAWPSVLLCAGLAALAAAALSRRAVRPAARSTP